MSLSKAADDIKSFAKRIKPILELAEVLEKLGSIDNAAFESKSRCEKALAEEKDALKLLNKKYEEVARAHSEIEAAKHKAGNLVSEAKAKSDEMLKYAEVKGEEIIAKANSFKSKVMSEAQAEQTKVEELKKDIASKHNELELLKKELADFKSKFSRL